MALDLNDIQGIIHHGYGCPLSRHLLFEIKSRTDGQSFLQFLEPRVTHAAVAIEENSGPYLNIGITCQGLSALGVRSEYIQRFPPAFREVPDPNTMGDLGENAPVNWWNKRFQTSQIHLIVSLFCKTSAELEQATADVRSAAGSGVQELFPMRSGGPLDCAQIGSVKGEVHFGYRDGLSQPNVAWSEDGPDASKREIDFRHFLLGYSTQEIQSAPAVLPSEASKPPNKAVLLAKNGSYSVFRMLLQDVPRFNQFLADEAPKAFPDKPQDLAEELLAAKMMGRWRNGTPLVLSPDEMNPSPPIKNLNDFGYKTDPEGQACPVTAHIRVTNPRDQELDSDAISLGGVPRVIRRGAPFGPRFEGGADDGVERGLAGFFICSNIAQQFYKMAIWMKETNFSPVFTNKRAHDPMGSRLPDGSDEFVIPSPAGPKRVTLQNFVTTLGTAFFLLPSRGAIRGLSTGDFSK